MRLAPEISGRIVALPMAEGQRVRQGHPLFALDQIQLGGWGERRCPQGSGQRRALHLPQSTRNRFHQRSGFPRHPGHPDPRQVASQCCHLGDKSVLSPIAKIGNINYKLGDVVQAGSVITTIVDNSKLWLRLDIPEGLPAVCVRRHPPAGGQPAIGPQAGATATCRPAHGPAAAGAPGHPPKRHLRGARRSRACGRS